MTPHTILPILALAALLAADAPLEGAPAIVPLVTQPNAQGEMIPVHWKDLPIKVVSPELEVGPMVDMWNNLLGFHAFVESNVCLSPCVFITPRAENLSLGEDKVLLGITSFAYGSSGEISTAVIFVYPPATINQYLWAVMHELGHVLGLGHTSTPGSIMNPSFEEPNPRWFVPDPLLEYIRGKYGLRAEPLDVPKVDPKAPGAKSRRPVGRTPTIPKRPHP